jgi:glycosyltransferase involved in cell wall biosynthesis
MKFAVNISTYKRKDGKTKEYLKRTLLSIKNQSHQDYKVFLIGDKYEDNDEFLEIASSIIDSSKIYYENLPFAYERDKYSDSEKLWCSGGTYTTNYAISKAIEEGYEWICHIDHDDIWTENHLLNFSNFIENNDNSFVFLASRCNYLHKYIVPIYSNPGIFYPTASDLSHSSVCINFSKIPLRYRDVYEETGQAYAADADLWNRISEYIKKNKLYAYLIDDVTLIYDKQEKL